MSAISGLSGSGTTQWLQQLAQQQTTQAAQAAAAASTSGAAGSIASSGNQASGSQGVHHGHHHRGGGGGGSNFFSQIQQTVTSALQSAQSNGTSDPNDVVTDALTSLLKNMGLASSSSTGSTNILGDSDGNAGGPAGAGSANSPQQTFQSLLQSAGISPQQFQSDFLTAVRDAQGGSVNPGTAFNSFPAGTTLDVMA